MKNKQTIKELILIQNPSVDLSNEADFSSSFAELGLDSIDVMTIVLKIKRELGIDINDEQLSKLGTVSELIEFLDNK
ncbi:acyl carrier protein [uncultured Pseudoalteromonas sp.]|uniref:acyl carrier protein n=1 Tax=uncultured Pseudoalteromonas sp. TaxID=114053 RepID=UPI0026303A57|nr:acyl carrier protein [uncultured Pseudoalteromonas sp.]